MANNIYPLYKQKILGGGSNVDLLTETVKAALVDITIAYSYDDADEFWDDVSTHQVGSSVTLTNKSVNNGVFACDNIVFPSVSGTTAGALVVYVDTGSASTSPLVTYIDDDITNLPVSPLGGNITILVNAGGLFKL